MRGRDGGGEREFQGLREVAKGKAICIEEVNKGGNRKGMRQESRLAKRGRDGVIGRVIRILEST
jgi:hypothetical protein